MFRLFFFLTYTALALLEFYSETLLPENPTLHYLTKPALLAALSLYFFRETHGNRVRRDMLFQTALGFAWLGDVLLMLVSKNQTFFLAGLGAFLIMQLLYIRTFWIAPVRLFWQLSSRRLRMAGILVLLLVIRVFLKIQPNLGDLTAPVLVYLLVIVTMFYTTLNRHERVPNPSFWLVSVGAFLFLVSDSFIAVEKFDGTGASWLTTLVMPTYAAAQYLIVEGVLRERVTASEGLSTNISL